MTKSSKKKNRKLSDVVPGDVVGLQANVCRTPDCVNYGARPTGAPFSKTVTLAIDKTAKYSLSGAVGETSIKCPACKRDFNLFSNRALMTELQRVMWRNGALLQDTCSNKSCENSVKPVNLYPKLYYRHGVTAAGKPRKKCKKCGSTITVGLDHKTKACHQATKAIIIDLVERASMSAIIRKTGLNAKTLYERIDFIHRQMVSYEAHCLQRLKQSPKFERKKFSICTDAQDFLINWASSHRRQHIQLSCITSADNLTGFILRSDVNFDPTVGDCGQHFEELLHAGDFDVPEGLGLSGRYDTDAFFDASLVCLKAEEERATSVARKAEISALKTALVSMISMKSKSVPDSANPVRGVVIKRTYTAIAHFIALSQMFRKDETTFHLMTDGSGSLLAGILIGMKERIAAQQVDVSLVTFNKDLTTPKKKGLVAQTKKQIRKFAQDNYPRIATVYDLRREYIATYSNKLNRKIPGIYAQWYSIPINTMYEPEKNVGIVYQRPAKTPEIDRKRKLTILDRTSLHAVDSFFNYVRKRVSYFHRPGHSRSSLSHYNAYQPYRADMAQKVIDITRVYYNWVDSKAFRVSKKFENIETELAEANPDLTSGHELAELYCRQHKRSRARSTMSTPAMRLGLAKNPIKLETILYSDWRNDLKF